MLTTSRWSYVTFGYPNTCQRISCHTPHNATDDRRVAKFHTIVQRNFKATKYWCDQVFHHSGLPLYCQISLCQNFTGYFEQKLLNFWLTTHDSAEGGKKPNRKVPTSKLKKVWGVCLIQRMLMAKQNNSEFKRWFQEYGYRTEDILRIP